METGSGERAASVIYDRAGSSFAEMDHLEWSLEELFQGIDIFHVSGITPALSKNGKNDETGDRSCKKSWLPDQLRYQLSWKIMDTARSQRSNPSAFTFSRYLLSWKNGCSLFVRYRESARSRRTTSNLLLSKMQEKFPNIQVFYSTKRTVHSASENELKGTLWMNHEYVESQVHRITPIVDRVGGGDAFAGGVLHGILSICLRKKSLILLRQLLP